MKGLRPRYRDFSFKGYDPKPNKQESALEDIRALAERRRWIFISSPERGIGKTRLAVSAAKSSWWHDTFEITSPNRIRELLFSPPLSSDAKEIKRDVDDVGEVVKLTYRHSLQKYLFLDVIRWSLDLEMAGIQLPQMMDDVVKKHRCVVMDELGRTTEKSLRIIQSIINEIFLDCGQLIVTTQLSRKDFFDTFDDAIKDRVAECGLFIELPGNKSYR